MQCSAVLIDCLGPMHVISSRFKVYDWHMLASTWKYLAWQPWGQGSVPGACVASGSTYLAQMRSKLSVWCMCVDRKYLAHLGSKCLVHACPIKVPGTHRVNVQCLVDVCRPKVPGTHGVKVKCPVHMCRPKVPGTHGVKVSGARVSTESTWLTWGQS